MNSGRLFTREDVHRENNGMENVLIIVHNGVYDVTKYLEAHPGGSDVLLEQGGKDGTVEFDLAGHSLDARELMEQYKIGELAPEEHTNHNRRCAFFYNVWTYLIPLGVAVIVIGCYKLYKRK
ncbi:hypothetical protein PR048_021238 [Dryococelus australis]|uniref:Cytochrome b5 n=1 Tax=Dryococelus australis TaxID=614101 RepID=A0ABQ9GXQ0_9NEOP|nr:hypothetical protein PR048_021238 [Dryococelus australis]